MCDINETAVEELKKKQEKLNKKEKKMEITQSSDDIEACSPEFGENSCRSNPKK